MFFLSDGGVFLTSFRRQGVKTEIGTRLNGRNCVLVDQLGAFVGRAHQDDVVVERLDVPCHFDAVDQKNGYFLALLAGSIEKIVLQIWLFRHRVSL